MDEFVRELSEIKQISDKKTLEFMLVETKNIVPECGLHNMYLMTKIENIQNRIKELEKGV